MGRPPLHCGWHGLERVLWLATLCMPITCALAQGNPRAQYLRWHACQPVPVLPSSRAFASTAGPVLSGRWDRRGGLVRGCLPRCRRWGIGRQVGLQVICGPWKYAVC